MKKDIIPQKLKVARLMKGLSMQALSDALGGMVTKQAISKYEQGKMRPSDSVLRSLSNILGFPLTYFNSMPYRICNIEFRVDEKVPQCSFDQMKAIAQVKIERYLKLEDMLALASTFSNPLAHLQITSYDDVELAACHLRLVWQLGNFPIASVYEILEAYGIRLIEFEAGIRDVLGFSTFANSKMPLIVVNLTANETTERKRFTALHELGHILLVFGDGISQELKERYCSRFASALLCPSVTMKREFGDYRQSFTLNELISLKKRYGISVSAIVHRAKDLGIITDKYYNEIFNRYIHKNRKEDGWGGYPIQEHTDRYLRLLQRAIAEKYLTWDEATELLGESFLNYKEEVYILK